ncbi:MAG: bifunctional phosphopantothenoylcysteine decarboxylase/phosphopantothenate--cysteine ligase CoaBC [Bacteroidia bacterium]|nr:bifunctional phosphopantothenoylcysteine decarboxylase/phosphopantothenate--cysteine ligase CoaBC [Bacteroidia bacterium]
MLQGKKIILALSGSIAAYKSVVLLRLLKKAGAEVKVVTTSSVDTFVGELTLSTLSGQPVFSGLWDAGWSEHVALGTASDLMVVAPATANTLAKMAHGLCDNALTAVYLAARCPVMVAPAMDADMYIHPRTAANLAQLAADGVKVLPVGSGFLASGLQGPGRMMEPEDIFAEIEAMFSAKPLAGKKILITAGPTREALDPVRFLTNHSSGKMGYALAEAARDLGAYVTLVSGPVALPAPDGLELLRVESAADMFDTVRTRSAQQDVIIKAAAVADYTPSQVAGQKMKKKDGELSIELKRTQDILAYLGEHKPSHQILVGFALETNNALENARNKLQRKHLDLIVLNTLEDAGAGFGVDTNVVTLIDKHGKEDRLPIQSKKAIAKAILDRIQQHLLS